MTNKEEKLIIRNRIEEKMVEQYLKVMISDGISFTGYLEEELKAKEDVSAICVNLLEMNNIILANVSGNLSKFYSCYERRISEANAHSFELFGVFSKDGEGICLQKSIWDFLEVSDEENFYEFQKQEEGYLVNHYHYDQQQGMFVPKEVTVPNHQMIKHNQLRHCFGSLPLQFAVFQLYRQNYCYTGDEYLLYQADNMKSLFTCQEVTGLYPDYPNVPVGKYLLVTKKIVVEDQTATLKFFIDKKVGNPIDIVFWEEKGWSYPLGERYRAYSTLDKIVLAVKSSLEYDVQVLKRDQEYVRKMKKLFKERKISLV